MGYSLPGAEERPFGAGRRAGPRDFDTGEGLEAIAQKVGETGDLAISLFEQEMESRVLGALSDATRAMTDLDQSVQSEPDHNKRMGMYQAGSQKISQEFRKGVKYPKYQEAFDARFFQQQESGRIAVLDNVRNAKIASAQAILMMSVETQMDEAKKNPDPVRRGQIYEEALMDIEAGEKGGTLSPVLAARMKIRVGDAEETESIIFDSYALADEIWDQHPDHEKRREAIREVPAHLRERVSGIVEGRYNREQAHEKEANDAQYIDVMKRAMTDMTTEELVDEELRARDTAMPWTPNQFAQLLSMIQERENKGKTLDAQATQAVLYSQLLRMAIDPTRRQEFLKMNLRVEFGHILDDDLLKALETDQKKGASKLDSTSDDAINVALSIMRLPVTNADFKSTNAENRSKALLFRERTEAALNQAASENQAPLPPSRVHEIVNGMQDVMTLEEKDYWPDTTERLWEITEEQFQEIVNVPEDAAYTIRRAEGLGEANDIGTLKKIRDIYVRILRARQQGRDAPFGVERLGW
tara:strand:+ start:541 stop:2121 length:1581 start_codon:yes stop_codon:yes gene_type:complete